MPAKLTTLFFFFLFTVPLFGQEILASGDVLFKYGDTELILPKRKIKFAKRITDQKITGDYPQKYFIKKQKIRVEESEFENLKDATDYFPLTSDGFLVLKFRRGIIKDVPGVDVFVFAEAMKESIELFVSKNGKEWIKAGTIEPERLYLDFAGRLPAKRGYKFLKLVPVMGSGKIANIKQVAISKPGNSALGIEEKIKDDTITTSSSTIKLQIRDFRSFDWDFISVTLNGRVLSRNKLLTKLNRFVNIPLKKGTNIIKVEAKNEGLVPPNTIDLKIVDGIIINIGTFRIRKRRTKSIFIIRE